MSSLFHLTKLNTAVKDILRSKTLKANSFFNTNDPRETFLWSFGGIDLVKNGYGQDPIDASFNIGYLCRKDAKLVCFTKPISGARNQMMWSHYGERHEGLCLELDKDVFMEENKDLLSSKLNYFEDVKYLREDSSLDKPNFSATSKDKKDSIENFINANYKFLFFQKSDYWEREDEQRLVVVDEDWDGLLSIKKSLKSVIIGIYTDESYIATIEQLIESNVNIKQCVFNTSSNSIEIEDRPRGEYREHIYKKFLKKFNY